MLPQHIWLSSYESIKDEQDDIFWNNPDPRLISADTAVRTLALSEYLRDFVKNINEEVEILIELEGQVDLIDDLTDAIIGSMSYKEAYKRFVEGNPPEKFRKALYPPLTAPEKSSNPN